MRCILAQKLGRGTSQPVQCRETKLRTWDNEHPQSVAGPATFPQFVCTHTFLSTFPNKAKNNHHKNHKTPHTLPVPKNRRGVYKIEKGLKIVNTTGHFFPTCSCGPLLGSLRYFVESLQPSCHPYPANRETKRFHRHHTNVQIRPIILYVRRSTLCPAVGQP